MLALGLEPGISKDIEENFAKVSWTENAPIESALFKDVEIMTGQLDPNQEVQEATGSDFFSLSSQPVDERSIFYLHSEINQFKIMDDVLPNSYEYYLLFNEQSLLKSTIEIEKLSFSAIYTVWLPIFICWSTAYMFVCYLII